MMNKQKALIILNSIYKDVYNNWKIPNCYKYCEKEVTLSNGQKATLMVEDEVDAFIDYVKKLIEAQEDC